MRRTLLCLLLLACCGSVFALDVYPPAPDSQTFIKVATRTQLCSVARTEVAVEGLTITVTVVPSATPPISSPPPSPTQPIPCPPSLVPLNVNVGVIPAGVYDLTVKQSGG